MPITINYEPQLPKKMDRSQLTKQSAEARAADLKVWRDTLYRSTEFREALFGNTYTDRFAYEGAAYTMNADGKLESANNLWDEPDRYHNAVMSDRLFVRDHHGMMRQVQVKENDSGLPELGLSQPLNSMSAVQEPTAPSWLKYLFILFFLGEIREYNKQKAIYDAMNTQEAKETFQSAIRSYQRVDSREEVEKVSGKQLQQQHEQIKQDLKQLDNELRQFEKQHNRGEQEQQQIVQEQQPAESKPVPAPLEQVIQQQPEQPMQNVEEKPKMTDKNQGAPVNDQTITSGLKPHHKAAIANGVQRMTYDSQLVKTIVPENCPLKLNGTDIGVLVAMAMGNPELSYKKSKTSDERVYNDPNVYYTMVVGNHYIQGASLKSESKAGAFKKVAERAVGAAIRASAVGDYSKMATIIAAGLTQNNKMLQAQRQLTDIYTAHAELGHKALQLMNSNEQLKKAVMDRLGADTKQIDMAKAAKNISDLRVDIMQHYGEMVKTYGVFQSYKVRKGDEEVIKERPAVLGSENHVAKVCLLCDIEVDMNKGAFKLEDSKFADPKTIDKHIKAIENTDVVSSFLWEPKRGELLQQPIQMKRINAAAAEEAQKRKEMRKKLKETGIDVEDQPKERNLEISF